MEKVNKLTKIIFIFYLVLLCWLVLFKLATNIEAISSIRNINLIPFADSVIVNGKLYLKEIIYNILAFVPLGVYLSIIKKDSSLFKKIIISFGLSFLFETVQYIFAIGGSDITDLIGNILGAFLGIGFYKLLEKIFKERTVDIVNMIGFLIELCAMFLLIVLLLVN